jgi:hypothetical protein
MPDLAAKSAFLKTHGITDPVTAFNLHRPDMPWISATFPEASLPLAVIPENVTLAGLIVLSSAPVAEQDPDLATWLARAPTVLINLGSWVYYTEDRAVPLARAVEDVLDRTGVQVLWKFRKYGEFGDEFGTRLRPYLESGRLRMENWLAADPPAILESGHVVASVHHGGANCYSETIA